MTPPTPGRARRTTKRKLLFSAPILLFALLVVEVVCRLGEWKAERHRAQRTRVHYSLEARSRDGALLSTTSGTIPLVLDPDVLFRLAPNVRRPGITTNEHGFRGEPCSRRKPPGTYRIILTGGSVAFGWSASSDERCIAPLLEERLSTPERPVEVINAGVPAYTLAQELTYLARVLLDYEPDLVVSLTGYNDLYRAYMGGLVTNEFFDQLELRLARADSVTSALLRSSALGRRVLRGLTEASGAGDHDRPASYPPEAARRFRGLLDRTSALLRGRLLVALQPAYLAHEGRPAEEVARVEAGMPAEDKRHFAAFLREALAAQREALAAVTAGGGRSLDLTRAFAGHPEPIFTDLVHVNDRGNEVLAERLAAAIEEELAADGR